MSAGLIRIRTIETLLQWLPDSSAVSDRKINLHVAVYTLAASGGIVGGISRLLQPQADYFSSLGLPAALIKWGHPGGTCSPHDHLQLSLQHIRDI